MTSYEKTNTLGYEVPFEYICDTTSAERAVKILESEPVLGVDTETTGLDPFLCKLLMLQMATPEKSFVIDARKVDISIFKPILESRSIIKILQNAKFDYKFLAYISDIRLRNIYDTMLAEMILCAGKQRSGFSLEALALKYLGIKLDKRTRKEFVGKSDIEFSQKQLSYAGNDAFILHEVYNQQVQGLIGAGLTKVALLEFGVVSVISEMELRGCNIDTFKWREFLKQAANKKDYAKSLTLKEFAPVIPQRTLFDEAYLNLDSPKQLLDALHRLGIDVPDTNEATLAAEAKDAPAVKNLLEYRSWNKILSTYGEKILSRIHKRTGRLHPKINQLKAVTGRSSSEDPNSQNLPKYKQDDPDSLDIRGCFIPSPGYKYVGADFSQQELRILAELSNDPTLLNAFMNGQDVHTKTAAEVNNIPLDKVTKEMRSVGKTLNFAIGYGASAFRISGELGCSVEEAQKVIDNYFKAFPKIKQFINKSYLFSLDSGYSETITGRRRYYEVPTQDDPDYNKKIGSLRRESCNHPIQGSAADVSKQALVNVLDLIEKAEIDACPVLFIHDEIVVECKEEHVEKCKNILEKAMVEGFTAFFKRVPMVVDVWISDKWIKV